MSILILVVVVVVVVAVVVVVVVVVDEINNDNRSENWSTPLMSCGRSLSWSGFASSECTVLLWCSVSSLCDCWVSGVL